MSDSRRVLPVVRWLQVGAVTAGLGMALGMASVATSGVATADDGAASTPSAERASHQSARAGSAAAQRSKNRSPQSAASQAARSRTVRQTANVDPASSVRASLAAPTAASVTASPTASASATTPSAKPGLGTVRSTMRLNMEDRRTGTGKPVVPAGQEETVVNGLFSEILRRTPTAEELTFYTRRLNMSGVNGVVAGLYNSQEFRANAVTNYYTQLLGKLPDAAQLKSGVASYTRFSLMNSPESYVASRDLAGGTAFYDYSASGGGPYGAKPTPTSYVNLLYRSLLGQPTDLAGQSLIQSIQGGLAINRAANQFVNTDAYRTVKVEQAYTVLGEPNPQPDVVAGLVANWKREGGQAGISQSLLATQDNVQNIIDQTISNPDLASAALLQTYMLAGYVDFVKGLKSQLQTVEGVIVDGKKYGCKGTSNTSGCNVAFYNLMSQGGLETGIPNDSLQTSTNFVQVLTLLPTQNNIDMDQSLVYPLRDPITTALYLNGGPISAPGGTILTADNGQYVIDGHHRWSALYVVNPYTSIATIDLGYVPTPQTALKEMQLAIGAREGYLPFKAADGPNLLSPKVTEVEFDKRVYDYIWTTDLNTLPYYQPPFEWRNQPTCPEGSAPGPGCSAPRYIQIENDPNNAGRGRPIVFNEFRDFLFDTVAIPGYKPGETLSEEDQVTYTQPIADYLWANVQRLRTYNQAIPDASPRVDMPQPLDNAYPPLLQLLETGNVIYTLPAISALG